MTIGVLSAETGVPVETIRYYERIGLLPRPARRAGGFREYDGPDAAGRLGFVVDGQTIKVYTIDGEENGLPVAGIAGAQALLQPEGGAVLTVPLAPMGDHLHGAIPASVTVYTSVVTVPVAGETRSARFEVGLDSDTDHALSRPSRPRLSFTSRLSSPLPR